MKGGGLAFDKGGRVPGALGCVMSLLLIVAAKDPRYRGWGGIGPALVAVSERGLRFLVELE